MFGDVLSVADLEIQKGGVQLLAREARPQFFGCHAHFRSRWKSELYISKQL